MAEPSAWLMRTTGPRNGRGIDLASLSHGFTPMNEVDEEERSTEVEDQYTWGVHLGCFFLANFVDSLMRRGFEFHMNWLLEGLLVRPRQDHFGLSLLLPFPCVRTMMRARRVGRSRKIS